MKRIYLITGICAVCLIALIFVAGCTSQPSENTQTPVSSETPQVTETSGATAQSASSSASDNAFADDSGSVPPDQSQQQVTLAPDEPVVTNTGAAADNLTSDSTDFGDITP